MRKVNLHTHTNFCDGKNTPEEMVISAINKNFDVLGFSSHSFTYFDGAGCIKDLDIPAYKAEIARLKEKYRGQIQILCGLEQDYYSTQPALGFDYHIGSIHACHVGGPMDCKESYALIDYSPAHLKAAADTFFEGDAMAVAECYFERIGEIVSKTQCDIIGHFDIISKFSEQAPLFDTKHPRYVAACDKALEKLLATDAIFEINTGAMSRGYRTSPYPAADILCKIKDGGGRIILSSDSHSIDTLDYGFDMALKLARECGFKSIMTVDRSGRFIEEKIVK